VAQSNNIAIRMHFIVSFFLILSFGFYPLFRTFGALQL